jgi:hypothetical protein
MATIDQIPHADRTGGDLPTVTERARTAVDERAGTAVEARAGTAVAERAARASLRDQIARLDRELATIVAASRPPLDPGPPGPSLAGPRILGLGDLERQRDRLVERLAALRAAAAAQTAHQQAARAELERMLADPPAHRWRRLSNADIGRPGCTTYHVRPKAGLLGMLMGWWQVKVSGGCPLAP